MGKHTLTPTITVSYGVAISAECSRGGDGQCDGLIPDEQMDQIPEDAQYGITDECACPCHKDRPGSEFSDAHTVEDMAQAHAKYHRTWA